MAARREMLRVFAYDITSDRRRAKVAAVLEEVAVRVQLSVFEARLSHREVAAVVARLRPLLTGEDRLRVYTIGADGLAHCRAVGGPPLPEKEDFWLL